MTAGYGSWPEPARTMARGIDDAVTAAHAGDAAAFADATGALGRFDHEQLVIVLGGVTRDLLESRHPGGLGGEDAEQVLRGCMSAAAGWYEPLDARALIEALTGALGISETASAEPWAGETGEAPAPDDSGEPQEAPDAGAVVAHGLLLIADLLTVAAWLPPVLEAALRELMRAQTVELP